MKNSIPEVSIAVQAPVQKKLLAKSLRTKVLEEWNRTSVVYPDKCIHDLFEEQVERTPAAVAVECAGSQITYGELNEQANRLAHYIRALGIRPEARVGICVERSIEMMVAMLATLKAGAAYVPLDPKYPAERLQYMLADSQAKLLLTQRKVQGPFAGSKTPRVVLDTVQEEIDSCPSSSPAVSLETQNAAYVIYTSGSTGKPKGVVIRHSSAVTLLYWARETYSNLELSGVLASTSICFDISVFEIFVPLSWGGTVIIAENAIQLPRLPEAARVTLINTSPSIMNELMKSKEIPAGVRTVNLAGEPLKRRLIEEIYRETVVKRVVNLYGPTEDTTYSTYIALEKGGSREVPIGRPIANTEVYVLDEELRPVEIGVAGDLYIGGDGLARGYLDRPELTAQSFIPHPFSKNPGARIYRTGDRARWNKDGILEFLGRIDHQVKVRGMRIELGEIETVLQEHPRVREATVIVHGDETDHKQLAAYFVANIGDCPEAAAARNIVDDWQMVFDESYRNETTPDAGTLNFAGLNSSYTGHAIPKEELVEWTNGTVERILELAPRKVLEIGCGTGLLLFRVAPSCEEYLGTDYSEQAIDYVNFQLQRLAPPLPQVRAEKRCANDLAGISGSYDVVVMNSVAQYFPSIEYFEEVLRSAIKVLAPGGKIFIGDARNFAQLKPFRSAVALQRSPEHMLLSELRAQVEEQAALEEELVFDPAYFYALPKKLSCDCRVEVRLKRGKYHNELIDYRYDVVLSMKREDANTVQVRSCDWLDWSKEQLTLMGVRERLRQDRPAMLGVSAIPDARAWTGMQAWHYLTNSDDMNAGQLRDLLASSLTMGIEPDAIWELGKESGYAVEIYYDKSGVSGHYCALFRHLGLELVPVALPERITEMFPTSPNVYVNDPVRASAGRGLANQLRKHLQKRLPDYMVPTYFIKLDEMPLNPNGKIDRNRLPAPAKHISEEQIIKPTTALEQFMAQIWEEVLAVESVGLNSNFVNLGGHSLVAMRILARVRDLFQVEVPVQTLLESRTLEDFAAAVVAHETVPGQTRKIADVFKRVQSMSA
jgi:amino acid adenylation domain-containing protein